MGCGERERKAQQKEIGHIVSVTSEECWAES